MKLLKNILVGFLVSFIGSIPLGFLNIVGYEIYGRFGIDRLNFYLLGIIAVEAAVIYLTMIFAEKLSANKRLLKGIDFFSIVFMLILAFLFWSHSKATVSGEDYLSRYVGCSSFMIGVILNSLNFVQLPFWVGWNLYLINAGYISVDKALKYAYIGAALMGTFVGMLAFILFLNLVTRKSDSIAGYLMSYIIPLFFIGFALLQAWRVYKKYYSASAKK